MVIKRFETLELCSESKILKSRILKMDIDETENPFGDGVGNRGVDDDDESIPLISTSSRRGSEDTTYHRTHGETSFIEGIDEHTPLITKETKRDEAWDRIKRKFPNINPANSSFTATLDEYDRVEVRLKRDRGKYHLLFNSDGEVNENSRKLSRMFLELLLKILSEQKKKKSRGARIK